MANITLRISKLRRRHRPQPPCHSRATELQRCREGAAGLGACGLAGGPTPRIVGLPRPRRPGRILLGWFISRPGEGSGLVGGQPARGAIQQDRTRRFQWGPGPAAGLGFSSDWGKGRYHPKAEYPMEHPLLCSTYGPTRASSESNDDSSEPFDFAFAGVSASTAPPIKHADIVLGSRRAAQPSPADPPGLAGVPGGGFNPAARSVGLPSATPVPYTALTEGPQNRPKIRP